MKLSGAVMLLLLVLTFPALTQEKDLPPAQAELGATERAFAKLAVERVQGDVEEAPLKNRIPGLQPFVSPRHKQLVGRLKAGVTFDQAQE